MSLVDTTKELDTSVSTLMSESIITKLFIEIKKVADSPVDVSWFNEMLNVIHFSKDIQTGFQHSTAYALALIEMNWDKLPVEVRSQYGFAFLNLAMQLTGKQRSTVDNYVRTAKLWFIDKVRPLGDVKVAVRDVKGKPTGQYEYKPFNPSLVDLSKLLIVNRRAASNEMTDELWEMLVDPYYSCEDLAKQNSSSLLSNGDKPSCYFEAVGPGILYTSNLETVMITDSLNWEKYDHNPAVKEGIDRLFKMLDLRRDEDMIYRSFKQNYIIEGKTSE